MYTITIGLENEIEFKRAGVVFRVDTSTIPAEMLTELVYHGLTQKIGDAAAGVKDDADAALAKMNAVYESLQSGQWGRERSVSTGPAWLPYALAIIRGKLGEANKAAYTAIPSDDQKARTAFLQGLFDGLTDEQRGAVQTVAEDALAADRAKKAAARAITGIEL